MKKSISYFPFNSNFPQSFSTVWKLGIMGFNKWLVYVSCTFCRKLRISHHTSITLVWKKPFIHTELSSPLKKHKTNTSTSKKVSTYILSSMPISLMYANWFEVTNFPNGLHIWRPKANFYPWHKLYLPFCHCQYYAYAWYN